MKKGFAFAETMTGTWTSLDGSTRPFRFELSVRSGPLNRFRRGSIAEVEGTVDAEGLATRRPVRGTLELRPMVGRIIRYEFDFTGDDGRPYLFAGKKDIRWLDPVRSWTELPGELRDGDSRLIGRTMSHFDLRRDALAFVRSFRPA